MERSELDFVERDPDGNFRNCIFLTIFKVELMELFLDFPEFSERLAQVFK